MVFVCVVSWTIAGVAIWLGMREARGLGYTVFASLYMWLPAVCAVIFQIKNQEKPLRNLHVSFRLNWWFLVAGIVPIVYSFMAMGISLLFPSVSFSVDYEGYLALLPAEQAELAGLQLSQFSPIVYFLIMLVSAVIAGYTINALFAFGEEFGWRAYLLRALKNKKLTQVSLITGAVWGLWHFPLILIGHNYPQHPVAGVGMMIVLCILLSPTMTYIVIKSKSVITAAIFHGTNNAIAGISLLYLTGGNDFINGVTGIAGFTALLLVNFAFYLYDKYVTKENIFTREIGDFFRF